MGKGSQKIYGRVDHEFHTNTDEMLNKDPKAQAQLEICLVRMPNQTSPTTMPVMCMNSCGKTTVSNKRPNKLTVLLTK